eukprot:5009822-Amphidinium_carterae.1
MKFLWGVGKCWLPPSNIVEASVELDVLHKQKKQTSTYATTLLDWITAAIHNHSKKFGATQMRTDDANKQGRAQNDVNHE